MGWGGKSGSGGGGVGPGSFTADRMVVSDSTGALAALGAATTGQLLMGLTGNAPVVGDLVGTSNQVTVTPGASTLTLSLPQNIHTGASPTFAGLTVSGLGADKVLRTGTGGLLEGVALASGELLAGVTGSAPVAHTFAGSTNISISLVGTAFTFSLAGIGASRMVRTDGSGNLEGLAATDGQILIGRSTGGNVPALGTITGTANQITVTNGPNTIGLSMPSHVQVEQLTVTTAGLAVTGTTTLTGATSAVGAVTIAPADSVVAANAVVALTVDHGSQVVDAEKPALSVLAGGVVALPDGTTIASYGWVKIAAPTFVGTAGGAAETVTHASTVRITGAPVAGGEITLTNSWALRVDAGASYFGGAVTVAAGGIAVTGNSTITGTLGGITTLTATTLAGTLSTAAQPNITSVGVLAAPHMTAPVVDSGGLTVTAGGATIGGASVITDTGANVAVSGALRLRNSNQATYSDASPSASVVFDSTFTGSGSVLTTARIKWGYATSLGTSGSRFGIDVVNSAGSYLNVVTVTGGGLLGINKSPSTYHLEVAGDISVDSGKVYRVNGTQVVSARATGYTNAMTGTANRATAYDTSTVTLPQLAERVKALTDDLRTHGLIGA